jgi:hypothetical protein
MPAVDGWYWMVVAAESIVVDRSSIALHGLTMCSVSSLFVASPWKHATLRGQTSG